MLSRNTNMFVDKYHDRLAAFVREWRTGAAGRVKRTPKGLAFVDQKQEGAAGGGLPQAANAAFLMLAYANGLNEGKLKHEIECFARDQVNYMLGRAPGGGGRSFVTGFGRNPPQQPAHCGASCAAPLGERCDARSAFARRAANPHTLVGALVAGPDANDAFADDRANLAQSRVTVDQNAALTGALAALVQMRGLDKLCSLAAAA